MSNEGSVPMSRATVLNLLGRATLLLEAYLSSAQTVDRRTAGLVFKRGHAFAFRHSEKLVVGSRPFRTSDTGRAGVVLFSDIVRLKRVDPHTLRVSFKDGPAVAFETLCGDALALSSLEDQIRAVMSPEPNCPAIISARAA